MSFYEMSCIDNTRAKQILKTFNIIRYDESNKVRIVLTRDL